MKMKSVMCGNEFAVRKDVAAKRAEKGITNANYVCLTCRPKKYPKSQRVENRRLERLARQMDRIRAL